MFVFGNSFLSWSFRSEKLYRNPKNTQYQRQRRTRVQRRKSCNSHIFCNSRKKPSSGSSTYDCGSEYDDRTHIFDSENANNESGYYVRKELYVALKWKQCSCGTKSECKTQNKNSDAINPEGKSGYNGPAKYDAENRGKSFYMQNI